MKLRLVLAALMTASIAAFGIHPGGTTAGEPVIAGSVPPDPARLARGEYLARVGGCHDCHTPGYAQAGGKAPRELWLTGDDTAWQGPWGSSFASNLRLTLQGYTDERWLAYARSLRTRPPMPWFTLGQMSDEDLLSLLTFVQALGPKGEPAPPALAPGEVYYGTVVRTDTVTLDDPR